MEEGFKHIYSKTKLSELITEFQILTKNANLTKLNKETLFNLLQLHDLLFNETFMDKLVFSVKNFEDSNSEKTDLLLIRLKSLSKLLTEQKYLSKFETSDYTKYEYAGYIDIYINRFLGTLERNKLVEDINKYNFVEIQLLPSKSHSKAKNKKLSIILNLTSLPLTYLDEQLEFSTLNIKDFKIRLITDITLKSTEEKF